MPRAVREMKSEEGSHAAHWRKDTECLGVKDLGDDRGPGVRMLINRAFTKNLPNFFAMLAAPSGIAGIRALGSQIVACRLGVAALSNRGNQRPRTAWRRIF